MVVVQTRAAAAAARWRCMEEWRDGERSSCVRGHDRNGSTPIPRQRGDDDTPNTVAPQSRRMDGASQRSVRRQRAAQGRQTALWCCWWVCRGEECRRIGLGELMVHLALGDGLHDLVVACCLLSCCLVSRGRKFVPCWSRVEEQRDVDTLRWRVRNPLDLTDRKPAKGRIHRCHYSYVVL